MMRTFQAALLAIILFVVIPEMPSFFFGFGMFLAGLLAGNMITDYACDYDLRHQDIKS